MANTTKISNYRSGSPRFGIRDYKDEWDNSVKISYLSPEELEEYRSGKRGGMKLFTYDDYKKMKDEGKSNREIAKFMQISEAALYNRLKVWKGEPLQSKKEQHDKATQLHTDEKNYNECNHKWAEEKAKYEQIIAELKSNLEQASADKLKIQELQKDIDFWKKKVLELSSDKAKLEATNDDGPDYHELFDNAMAEKENLQKEILILENQIKTLQNNTQVLAGETSKRINDLSTEKDELQLRYNVLLEDFYSLKEEAVPLRQLVLINLRNKKGALT
jgi:transposase